MTNPIINDLETRYTTKSYDPNRKVSSADLNILLEALHLSASSINSQPWKFIVLESTEAKQRFYNTFANKFQFNQAHALAASHTILFAHNPCYNKSDYDKVIDQYILDGRTKTEEREKAYGSFSFVDLNTDETGYNGIWTRSQTYIALGNALHTLARLGINSTPMEGVDSELIGKEFANELGGYVCQLALAIGYSNPESDYNAKLPKSRLPIKDVILKI